MHSLRFTATSSSNAIVERDFSVGDVPGVLWSPTDDVTGPAPLVLMGHGGGNHKKHPAMSGRAAPRDRLPLPPGRHRRAGPR